jgi:hypothetical protein
LNRESGKKADRALSAAAVKRHRRRNFTAEVYGARLPYEDARVIDDYARANKLDRSEAVRRGLHQFVLRQKMLYTRKDPLRESLEQVVAEQIEPVRQRTEEMMALLNDLAGYVVGHGRSLPRGIEEDGDRGAPASHDGGTVAPPHAHTRRNKGGW